MDGAVLGLMLRIGPPGATWSMRIRVVGEGGVTNRGHQKKGGKFRLTIGEYPATSIEAARSLANAYLDIELSMRYKAHTRSQELHEYRLLVSIANRGTKRITEWQADVEIPRPLLTKDQARLGEANRSTKQRTVRRFTEETDGHLLPGDAKTLEIRYQVNHVFEKQNHVLDDTIRAQRSRGHPCTAEGRDSVLQRLPSSIESFVSK